eukprot:254546-Pelagomonas_calceolata.AAC.5
MPAPSLVRKRNSHCCLQTRHGLCGGQKRQNWNQVITIKSRQTIIDKQHKHSDMPMIMQHPKGGPHPQRDECRQSATFSQPQPVHEKNSVTTKTAAAAAAAADS